jgi:hypothetical protein
MDQFTPDPSAYLGEGESSREAVERRTRTPMYFTRNAGGGSGQFSGQNLLGYLLKKYLPSLANSSGIGQPNIQVNPFDPDNTSVPDTIRHESIHALLAKIPGGIDPKDSPGYENAFTAIAGRAGNRDDEIPAYMGAYEPQKIVMDRGARDAFVKDFAAKIARKDPKAAQVYLDISRAREGR